MPTTPDFPLREQGVRDADFATGIERVLSVFVNAYLVDAGDGEWVLVDTGLPGLSGLVRRAAERRFGERAPRVIVLTHGHFDHAGGARHLADTWQVPVYAHRMELPYLTGRSAYPPADPTVGGALGVLSRTFPSHGSNLGERVQALPDDGAVPGLPGWRWLHTPGHTPGHVSLLRAADDVLLAGDAFATVNQDSAVDMATMPAVLSVPPAPLTTDWRAAQQGVTRLAGLRPTIIAAGHGLPVRGPSVADDLTRFAAMFTPPASGRYVAAAAEFDETGVRYVPPPADDPLPRQLLAAAAVVGGVGLGVAAWRRRTNGERDARL